ncbi:PAS domain-containing protein [Thalassococcus sp. S3]|uniref:PAS domain-containing protein n=1 Tax=Thalassococcus sp. S3 TaxID=2017482 RepID=UPI0010242DA7|nr:PAS domain-containing protein [Thalassococcus sp. S3]QBF32910.1 hypothetical protein CFI11_17030 [Thalassococcus sp. S3]
MKIKLLERTVPPRRDSEILDILGSIAPSMVMSLIQTTSDCVKVLSVDGRLMFVNQIGLDELMGGAMDEVRDTVWSAYWPAVARPALEEALDLTLGGRHIYCEVPRPTEDGMDRLWSINLTPIYTHSEEVEAVLVMSRDLTANANYPPLYD